MKTVCENPGVIVKNTFNIIGVDQISPEVWVAEANLCVEAKVCSEVFADKGQVEGFINATGIDNRRREREDMADSLNQRILHLSPIEK